MATQSEAYRCMACGHEFEEPVEKGVDRERQCPRCRSNSVHLLKHKAAPDPKAPAA